MFSKTFSYKDATVKIDGMTGKVDVTCRNLQRKGITPAELIELAYPAIDAAAKLEAESQQQEQT
jgi:hypothetical protein